MQQVRCGARDVRQLLVEPKDQRSNLSVAPIEFDTEDCSISILAVFKQSRQYKLHLANVIDISGT